MAKKTKAKDPRGRKARGGEASSNVTVRLNASEREAFQTEADAEAVSLAEWIRAACQDRLARKKRG